MSLIPIIGFLIGFALLGIMLYGLWRLYRKTKVIFLLVMIMILYGAYTLYHWMQSPPERYTWTGDQTFTKIFGRPKPDCVHILDYETPMVHAFGEGASGKHVHC